jgi:hypothetical protein
MFDGIAVDCATNLGGVSLYGNRGERVLKKDVVLKLAYYRFKYQARFLSG